MKAKAVFKIQKWDEKPYHEGPGEMKLTRAMVAKSFQGDIQGESSNESLMVYPTANSASFVGLERVTGRLGDRSGSFVLLHTGTYADGVARSSYSVVPGTGTGDLAGLRGQGAFSTGHAEEVPMTLEYSFE